MGRKYLKTEEAKRAALEAALELLSQVAAKHKTNAIALQSRVKTNRFCKARKEFCTKGVQLDFRRTTLALALKRDHSTVTVYAVEKVRTAKRIAWKKWRDKNRPSFTGVNRGQFRSAGEINNAERRQQEG